MSITTIAAEGEKQAVIIAAQGFVEVEKSEPKVLQMLTKLKLSNHSPTAIIQR
ncbi:MAG: hypothetical protein NBV77_04850 [Bacteroidia bacterium]|nr:hypothetical protein [Bacteroidia bacterium]